MHQLVMSHTLFIRAPSGRAIVSITVQVILQQTEWNQSVHRAEDIMYEDELAASDSQT
jgi:hypothetical protein